MKPWASHEIMVATLAKQGEAVLDNLTPEYVDLWHAATGVCTEAGELLDCIKKTVIYNKPLDVNNIIEELDDLEFYITQVRLNLKIKRWLILQRNMKKLYKRYAEGYSDQAAQQRADKA